MLANSRCVSFYETIEVSSKLFIRFLSNLCKKDLNTVVLIKVKTQSFCSIKYKRRKKKMNEVYEKLVIIINF